MAAVNGQKCVAHKIETSKRTNDIEINEKLDFSSLFLSEIVLDGLRNSGFVRPSPIQLKAIPLGRCGLDLIVQAKSGTGKTCVFSVIALDGLVLNSFSPQVLMLAPTREIAIQIHEVVMSIGSSMAALRCQTFIGGMPISEDKQKIKNCHIVIGTPGRVKQLIEEDILKTDSIRLFVLDEADKLLEESFQKQVNWIYSALPENKQILALSATYPEYLAQHLTAYMRDPTFVRLNSNDPALLGIKQYYETVPHHTLPNKVFDNKADVLMRILTSVSFQQCLVFSNYQTRAEDLSNLLNSRGWPSAYIAGSHDQRSRNETMQKLKSFKCRILISTDLTSRGIDCDKVNLVINLDLPPDHETYLHRIGRAGRFGSFGAAVSLVSEGKELTDLQKTEKRCNTKIAKLPDPIPSNLTEASEPVYLDDLVSSEQIITRSPDKNKSRLPDHVINDDVTNLMTSLAKASKIAQKETENAIANENENVNNRMMEGEKMVSENGTEVESIKIEKCMRKIEEDEKTNVVTENAENTEVNHTQGPEIVHPTKTNSMNNINLETEQRERTDSVLENSFSQGLNADSLQHYSTPIHPPGGVTNGFHGYSTLNTNSNANGLSHRFADTLDSFGNYIDAVDGDSGSKILTGGINLNDNIEDTNVELDSDQSQVPLEESVCDWSDNDYSQIVPVMDIPNPIHDLDRKVWATFAKIRDEVDRLLLEPRKDEVGNVAECDEDVVIHIDVPVCPLSVLKSVAKFVGDLEERRFAEKCRADDNPFDSTIQGSFDDSLLEDTFGATDHKPSAKFNQLPDEIRVNDGKPEGSVSCSITTTNDEERISDIDGKNLNTERETTTDSERNEKPVLKRKIRNYKQRATSAYLTALREGDVSSSAEHGLDTKSKLEFVNHYPNNGADAHNVEANQGDIENVNSDFATKSNGVKIQDNDITASKPASSSKNDLATKDDVMAKNDVRTETSITYVGEGICFRRDYLSNNNDFEFGSDVSDDESDSDSGSSDETDDYESDDLPTQDEGAVGGHADDYDGYYDKNEDYDEHGHYGNEEEGGYYDNIDDSYGHYGDYEGGKYGDDYEDRDPGYYDDQDEFGHYGDYISEGQQSEYGYHGNEGYYGNDQNEDYQYHQPETDQNQHEFDFSTFPPFHFGGKQNPEFRPYSDPYNGYFDFPWQPEPHWYEPWFNPHNDWSHIPPPPKPHLNPAHQSNRSKNWNDYDSPKCENCGHQTANQIEGFYDSYFHWYHTYMESVNYWRNYRRWYKNYAAHAQNDIMRNAMAHAHHSLNEYLGDPRKSRRH